MTSYGKNFTVRLFGGSHDPEIGVTAEGLPAGIPVNREALQTFLLRRAPGRNRFSTARKEADLPVFLSGLNEDGLTDGSVLRVVIRSENARSADYDSIRQIPRPSHADYPALVKSGGTADLRGGGHFSGRLTAPLCVLGGILKAELERRGVFIGAHIASVGAVFDRPFDPVRVCRADFDAVLAHGFPVLDENAGAAMQSLIDSVREEHNSVGGSAECAVIGLPVGVGEHFFDGMESRIASLVFAIPAVRGVEFGDGFGSAAALGSDNNDPYCTDGISVFTKTNHSGGILGGMTTGMPLLFRAAFKPTPSIGLEQDSVNLETMTNVKLTIEGRHDPCVVPRAVPVVEAAAAIAAFDALLDNPTEMER